MALSVFAAPSAAAEPIPGIPKFKHTVNVSRTYTAAVNFNKVLASCSAGVGGTCSISKSFSVTRTIQLGLNMSRGAVAAQLGWSEGTSVTVTAQCNSRPFTKGGQVYRAYPQGIKKRYTITKKMYIDGKLKKTTTAGPYEAFSPKGVSCHLS
ncbi:hypothetical protein ACTMTI_16755 [Nonomuraea sp. H19]|uniref:hypothetical protein n=1 Tax=Nonomuraea sp. H19 TaxID=3452206 RepID=UPI003F8BB0B7